MAEAKKVSALELIDETDRLINAILQSGGEVSEEIEQQLDVHEGTAEEVFRRYRYRIKTMEARAKNLAAEAQLLSDASKRLLKHRDRLKAIALQALESYEELTGEHIVAFDGGSAYVKRSRSVAIHNEESFIEQHKGTEYVSLVPKINKSQIKDSLNNDRDVYGATIAVNTTVVFR